MMRPHLPRRIRLLAAALLATLALSVGGAAYAAWSGSGSGTGSATTETTLAVTLSPGNPSADLSPGGQADVVLTVSNPNASPVRIGSLSLDTGQGIVGFGVDREHSRCAVSTLSFTTQTNGGAGWDVPARVGAVDGTLPITLTNALAMSSGAADACQGAGFTTYLVAGP